jgi:hypothetical protein
MFFSIYGSPALQAAVGVESRPARRVQQTVMHKELLRTRIAELKSRITAGGVREAVIRALLYAGMGRSAVDERGFETVRRMRQAQASIAALPLPAFKALVREQYLMLLLDQEAALAAIPSMLPAEEESRRRALAAIRDVLGARGALSATDWERLDEIAKLFDLENGAPPARKRPVLQPTVGLDKAS